MNPEARDQVRIPFLLYEKRPRLFPAVFMLTITMTIAILVFNYDKSLVVMLLICGFFVFRNGIQKHFLPPDYAKIENQGLSFYKRDGNIYWKHSWNDIEYFKPLNDTNRKTIGIYLKKVHKQSGFLGRIKESFRQPDARLPAMEGHSVAEVVALLNSFDKRFTQEESDRTF